MTKVPSAGMWKRCDAMLSNALRGRTARRGLLAGSMLAAGLVSAQDVAPAHWVAYAQATGTTLQERLSTDAGELVTRLHTRLAERTQIGAPPSVVVQVWITPDGQVERSAFDTLGDTQADADLRAILAAKPLQGPPPVDMRQPLVLRLTLQPNPEHVPDAAAGSH